MNHTLVAVFSFALLVCVCFLVREVRFRRALQVVVRRLLSYLRSDANEENPIRDADRRDNRL